MVVDHPFGSLRRTGLMFSHDQYALLDFGDGRKLERFGEYVLDRETPATDGYVRSQPELWSSAHLRYDRNEGWRPSGANPWRVQYHNLQFVLQAAEAGQVGLFPEQAANWAWLQQQISSRPSLKVLNLFAYTGGSTLASAAAGAEVVHIDAVQSVVDRARRNAELSGLADRHIRWIAEDAVKFVDRELRRGHRYDAVILDPPTYGHGTGGRVWKIASDLPLLLHKLAQLTAGRRAFILLSCHSPNHDSVLLGSLLRQSMGPGDIESGPLSLISETGRSLPSGHFARWIA